MQYANIIEQTEGPLPSRYGSTQAGSWQHDPELHMRHGWRVITSEQQPDAGNVVVTRSYAQDADNPQGCVSTITEQEPEGAAQDRQTADDVGTYGGILMELAGLLAAFPGIEAGMGYQQISDIMSGHVAGLDGDQLARASVSILRADNLFTGRLFPAGITGERFWRAMGSLQ